MDGLVPGRMVYYHEDTGDLAAVVTRVVDADQGVVNLASYDDREAGPFVLSHRVNIAYDDGKQADGPDLQHQPNTWHWPEVSARARTAQGKPKADPTSTTDAVKAAETDNQQ